jgi:Protein of unknown function (DUF2478)
MTTTGSVRLAGVVYSPGFKIDDFLGRVAGVLAAEGVKMAGLLQENAGAEAGVCAAMTLTDLATGRRFRISQELGSQAEGCRLDPQGLAEAGVLLDRPLGRAVELLLLNRLGTAEAEGGGLRSVFVRAMEAGVPLLTAVRPPYLEAWLKFHGGLACDLPTELDTVLAWCRNAVGELRAARQAELSAAD